MDPFNSLKDMVNRVVEGKIDYEGQRVVEKLSQQIIIGSAVAGFSIGFVLQSLLICLIVFAVGVAVALVAIVPPYPIYNRHPAIFLPPLFKDRALTPNASTNTVPEEGNLEGEGGGEVPSTPVTGGKERLMEKKER